MPKSRQDSFSGEPGDPRGRCRCGGRGGDASLGAMGPLHHAPTEASPLMPQVTRGSGARRGTSRLTFASPIGGERLTRDPLEPRLRRSDRFCSWGEWDSNLSRRPISPAASLENRTYLSDSILLRPPRSGLIQCGEAIASRLARSQARDTYGDPPCTHPSPKSLTATSAQFPHPHRRAPVEPQVPRPSSSSPGRRRVRPTVRQHRSGQRPGQPLPPRPGNLGTCTGRPFSPGRQLGQALGLRHGQVAQDAVTPAPATAHPASTHACCPATPPGAGRPSTMAARRR